MDRTTSATSLLRQLGASVETVPFEPALPGGNPTLPSGPDTGDASGHQHDEGAGDPLRYRTIWLSDIHLGSSGCQAPYLLDFLRYNESEYLYLVGDIIDGWQLKKGWYWPQAHNDVVQKVLRKARKGTQVI